MGGEGEDVLSALVCGMQSCVRATVALDTEREPHNMDMPTARQIEVQAMSCMRPN